MVHLSYVPISFAKTTMILWADREQIRSQSHVIDNYIAQNRKEIRSRSPPNLLLRVDLLSILSLWLAETDPMILGGDQEGIRSRSSLYSEPLICLGGSAPDPLPKIAQISKFW